MKTNAMRILEELKIDYTTLSYTVDPQKLDAIHAAKELGIDPERLFKTIVMINDSREIFVFCVPAPYEISLKKIRSLTSSKNIDLVKLSDLQKLTGYIRGGCSPLGMTHKYTTYIEESALIYDRVYVSAGVRGTMLCLKPEELAAASRAEFESLI
ncbi:MAG: Cys-tRNA(Pro) deacylase [Sphaerochaetaceae bacterium]|nr:Cys-tRNA(Pro) deacylase [Sphaerochaetaceae bacterium]